MNKTSITLRLILFSCVGIYLVLHNHPGWGIFSLMIAPLWQINIVGGDDDK